MGTDRRCRECGIEQIEPGMEVDGQPLCWADDDLCSHCQDRVQAELVRDAMRYRYLRRRRTRPIDVATGGVFAGQIPENLVLGGEHLDRAVDAGMGQEVPEVEPLEDRLARCLAAAIDTPVLTVRHPDGGRDLELHLSSFLPDLSEQAAELLEEAGR